MRYKGKNRIKALIAAGLLSVNLAGCKEQIHKYSPTLSEKTSNDNEFDDKKGSRIEELIDDTNEKTEKEINKFKEKLQKQFSTFDVTLDKSSDAFISNIIIDGMNVTIELIDGSDVSGILYNLNISNVNFENFYLYDSAYIDCIVNYSIYGTLYSKHLESNLSLSIRDCSVNNEYKKGLLREVKLLFEDLDYYNCRRLWLADHYILRDQDLETFSSMPNLDTLILTSPNTCMLSEENISIHSDSLRNIIIDVYSAIDKFDFTGCPNLETLSISSDTQETDLSGLKGLSNLKNLAFGVPYYYDEGRLMLGDFQERIDLVSKPFPIDDLSLCKTSNCFISDISAINGSNIEVLNISFLRSVSSNMLLETVQSLPNLKQIVGFEVNNAGMCSEELIRYCKENEIEQPFTERSLEIKHKLQEIVSNLITEDMDEKEKIKILSEYIVSHMEYDWDLISETESSPEKIIKGWGECLYYSIIEGRGICQGYTMYAQNLFTEAGITSFKSNGIEHTWNLIQIDDEYYFIDLTSVDGIIDEENSTSFDDYDVGNYYLVSIENIENKDFFYICMLPVEAEEKYKEARESRESEAGEKVGKYMLQSSRENLNSKSYSELYGTIGILCALGLAKKVKDKARLEKILIASQSSSLENIEGIKKVNSLNEVFKTLRRSQKIEELRSKRETANIEKIKNDDTKKLEIEAIQAKRGESIR